MTKDLSFELQRGESLGLLGVNGAGKSTLLKMLNGIIRPDSGSIRMKGRIGALIEVGAGFHPMLSGRENIYVNGAILGMSKREIDRKMESIIDFSGLDSSILDAPVKTYSSGMYVRLGSRSLFTANPTFCLLMRYCLSAMVRSVFGAHNTLISILIMVEPLYWCRTICHCARNVRPCFIA